jgi:hypothetical protein
MKKIIFLIVVLVSITKFHAMEQNNEHYGWQKGKSKKVIILASKIVNGSPMGNEDYNNRIWRYQQLCLANNKEATSLKSVDIKSFIINELSSLFNKTKEQVSEDIDTIKILKK